MKRPHSCVSVPVVFALSLAGLGIFFYTRIFGNVCIDGDTLGYVTNLARSGRTLTLARSIYCMGWFSKFHLSLFPLLYITARAYAAVDGWDLLTSFKILSYLCTLGAFCLLYFFTRRLIKRLPISAMVSIAALLTLGPCWMAITCDDNAVATFFELLFLVTVYVCCRRLAREEGRWMSWGSAAGFAAGLSLAAHLKSVVSLPVMLAPLFVREARARERFRTFAMAVLGLLLSFGGLYLLYYVLSGAGPGGSRTDFLVFHRQPGRFFFVRYESGLTDWLYFIYIGIRSTLYAFQELYIYTNLLDGDFLGPLLIALFFVLYGVAVVKTWGRFSTRLLFFFFLCHMIHSSLYDSWVSERWDAIVIPVVVTIGIFLDDVWERGRRRAFRIAATAVVSALMAGLVATNFIQTARLLSITGNVRPYEPSAYHWPYPKKAFFFFNHVEYYRMARELDGYFDDSTGFLPLRYTQPSASHAVGYLDQYLRFYSKGYRTRQIGDVADIARLVREGRLKKLLYIERLAVPFYHEDRRGRVVFEGAATRTLYEGNQITLKEVSFAEPAGNTEGD